MPRGFAAKPNPTPRQPNPSVPSPFDHAYAVILAGGSGTRFWPLSRRKRPKQLLRLFGGRSLLQQALDRLEGLIPPARICIVTGEEIEREVRRQLPRIPAAQFIAEPVGRNTAPAIGLAAHEILRRDSAGAMVVLPSDHLIQKPAVFRHALRAGLQTAAVEGRSVILGIKPDRAETGYGYVRLGEAEMRSGGFTIFRVRRFTEKPSAQVARRYVSSGKYLWNGGMFIWKASTLLSNLDKYQPHMASLLARISAAGGARSRSTLGKIYPQVESISIDYALMEKVPKIFAIAVDMGWSDVGSWAAAYEKLPKNTDSNVAPPGAVALGSRGNMIISSGKLVAAVGVHDLVIVETQDALLVCAREHSQDVGKVVKELARRGMRELL